jgi:hypothetical protein
MHGAGIGSTGDSLSHLVKLGNLTAVEVKTDVLWTCLHSEKF